jgi:hypothetical protein
MAARIIGRANHARCSGWTMLASPRHPVRVAMNMMKVVPLVGLCAVAVTCAGGLRPSASRQVLAAPQRHLVAYQPMNNDLNPDNMEQGPAIGVPGAVEKRLQVIAQRALKRWRQFCGRGKECVATLDRFFGPVVRIQGPPPLELYVFKRTIPAPGGAFYYFVLFDPRTGAATPNPPSIFAKWMELTREGNLKRPVVTFVDFDHDGRLECVVEEVVHNGSLYNALMYHYYAIEPNLGLRHVLAIETNYLCLDFQAPGARIMRTIRAISPEEIELTAVLELPARPPERIGVVRLTRPDLESPFRVRSRQVFVERYRGLLVSGSGDTSDNQILRDGYRVYY